LFVLLTCLIKMSHIKLTNHKNSFLFSKFHYFITFSKDTKEKMIGFKCTKESAFLGYLCIMFIMWFQCLRFCHMTCHVCFTNCFFLCIYVILISWPSSYFIHLEIYETLFFRALSYARITDMLRVWQGNNLVGIRSSRTYHL